MLRPCSPRAPTIPPSSRICARLGDRRRHGARGEAYAETAYLGGRPEDALNQLERLKKRDDLDYYQRSRIDARIAEITPAVLEFRERGLRPGDRGDQCRLGRPSFTVHAGNSPAR